MEEPQIDAAQMPRTQPLEVEDAMRAFEIKPGFKVVLAASEPDVVDPIAIVFDADGGMYVIEMRGYSERRDDRLGRIRYLRDTDGDGVFETSSIFKDGLRWPTALVCYDGGVFVGATPDLFYFRDNDGDGVSDEERLVFTGFGPESGRLNMQALFNSFHWGPDNRIWGAGAASGGRVSTPVDASVISLRRKDFSFDPDSLDFRTENGTAQFGMTFDSRGRRFVSANSQHAIWVAYERRHIDPSPYYSMPRSLVDIPEDGGAAPVYRISPDEPWRIVRTRWRVSGVVKGMIEGGGRVSGYFTSASGIHAYWGGEYGSDFWDNLFIGDVGSNLVHRKRVVEREGSVQPIAVRPDDERETEFLRSRDNWFRPVSFATGPDGCLYICDMYRETIEHPWSLPPGIKMHLDLNSGNDRGRIYRIEPVGFERSSVPALSGASNAELLKIAKGTGGDWQVTTARRLLFERGIPVGPKPVPDPFPSRLKSSTSLMPRFEDWAGDVWLEAMILNSLRTVGDVTNAWIHPGVADSVRFSTELAKVSGRTGDRGLIGEVAQRLAASSFSVKVADQLSALREGAVSAGLDWESAKSGVDFSGLEEDVAAVIGDPEERLEKRLAGIRFLGEEAGGLGARQFEAIVERDSASDALIVEATARVANPILLLDRLDGFSAEARRVSINRIVSERAGALALLDAIGAGSVRVEWVPADVLDRLRRHGDAGVAARAVAVLPRVESRLDVVARYERALSLAGDAAKGEVVYERACMSCHQSLDGRGIAFGPPVASFATAGKASLLANILDPNREVAPQYQAFQFMMNDGRIHVGLIDSEDNRSVSLGLPGGVREVFPRTEVVRMEGLGRSLMPEGLEQTVSVAEMADLLAYLTR